MKMWTRYVTLIVSVFMATVVHAQKALVAVWVAEEVTNKYVDSLEVKVYYQDSILVDSKRQMINDDERGYTLEIDYRVGDYLITFSKPGYETTECRFTLKSRRNSIFVIEGRYYMKKIREINLREAVVKATRIKMVTRGDTLVYDADAFELAEGSMLDALVEQLPGVELSGGQIKVNGKFVESLLVNGEDFFSGSPQVALQNLPAYTVKTIKVYDKAANDAYLNKKPTGIKKKLPSQGEHIVMDINLKKAYATGWMANAEGTYGFPNSRYTGRAFVLGYTDRFRLTAYANANNMNNTQGGTQGGAWGGGWSQEGELKVQLGGLDYLYKRGEVKLLGNLLLTHELPEVEYKTSSVNYYDPSNVYKRARSLMRDDRFHLITQHELQYSAKHSYSEACVNIDYQTNSHTSFMRSAEFNADIEEQYRLQALDTLFLPQGLHSRFATQLLNLYNKAKKGENNWFFVGLSGGTTLKLPNSNDQLRFWAGGHYRRDANDALIAIHRAYGAKSALSGTGERISQREEWISYNYDYNAGVRYVYRIYPYCQNKLFMMSVMPELTYARYHHDQDHSFWQLREHLSDSNLGSIIPPSAINPQHLTMDLNNSIHSRYVSDSYVPSVQIEGVYVPNHQKAEQQYSFYAILTPSISRQSIHYFRHALDTIVTRWHATFAPILRFSYEKATEVRGMEFGVNYSFSQVTPSIYYELGTYSDSDPMNIYINKPGLSKSLTHKASARLNYVWNKTHRSLSLAASYNSTAKAIAYARRYNRDTGVNLWTPENVDGNWHANGSVQFSTPFGKEEAFQLQSNTSTSYVHSVDYATTYTIPERSVVRNLTLGQRLSLSYKVGKHQFGLDGGVSWLQSRSALGLFAKISALDYNARAKALVHLPLDMELSTDLNCYIRQGYADATLNTTHWVWNASVTKTLLKGNLTLKLTGIDMLGQISNVQHSINAQGRTETWVNTLPRYITFSLLYRFHKVPKKKNS